MHLRVRGHKWYKRTSLTGLSVFNSRKINKYRFAKDYRPRWGLATRSRWRGVWRPVPTRTLRISLLLSNEIRAMPALKKKYSKFCMLISKLNIQVIMIKEHTNKGREA